MPMKLDQLTPEQEAMLPQIRDEWIHIGLSTEPADRADAEAGVRSAYKAAGLEPPRLMLWLRSPMEGAVAASVVNQVRAQVGDQVRAQVEAQVRAQVWDQVGAQVWAQVWAQVGDQVRDQVGAQVGRAIWGQHDAGWLAWCSVYAPLLGGRAQEAVSGLGRVGRNAGWWWAFAGCAILTERHNVLHLDGDGRPHCETGPAVAYPDGWGVHCWRGTRVPGAWIEDRESLSVEIALTWENIEQRRCAAEILGWDRILSELPHTVVDDDPDPEIGTLIRADLPGSQGAQFLRVRCGTGRTFVLPMPPDVRTAREGNAWSYGIDPAALNLEYRT